MTPSKDGVSTYAAACNPPRRAKRLRADADTAAPSAATSQHQPRPHLLPKEAQPGRRAPSPYQESSDDEDEYEPVDTAPAPKRRGRKPGPMSRSARESQRKLNHSRIEKARRTKINETLATLSSLVSEADKERAAADPSTAVVETGGREKGEKEFKLDVLVKTAAYIQELIQKVKTLEGRTCSKCSSEANNTADAVGAKRKRPCDDVEDEEVEVVKVSHSPRNGASSFGDHEPNDATSFPSPQRAASRQPGQSPCLPPISAWLPHPYIDPSCLSDANFPPSSNQLPTPPLSGSFRMSLGLPSQTLPALSLPAPAHPMSSYPPSSYPPSPELSKSSRMTVHPSRRMSSSSMRSPPVSPAWTPEDETAASMLLQMSSSPTSSVSGSSVPTSTPKIHPRNLEAQSRRPSQGQQMRAETPGSLLGLGKAT